jgi:hypothetical protein
MDLAQKEPDPVLWTERSLPVQPGATGRRPRRRFRSVPVIAVIAIVVGVAGLGGSLLLLSPGSPLNIYSVHVTNIVWSWSAATADCAHCSVSVSLRAGSVTNFTVGGGAQVALSVNLTKCCFGSMGTGVKVLTVSAATEGFAVTSQDTPVSWSPGTNSPDLHATVQVPNANYDGPLWMDLGITFPGF